MPPCLIGDILCRHQPGTARCAVVRHGTVFEGLTQDWRRLDGRINHFLPGWPKPGQN